MLSAVTILAGCSKDDGGDEGLFTPPTQEQLKQNAYADNESTGGGFSFTTDAPWTATVNEVQPSAQASASFKSTPANSNGNHVVWLKLYNGDEEAYSGGAGTITLRIEIDQNYTGERREATITISSGNNTFTVTVVQEGTKQDGTPNEAPIKVTKVTLDKAELSLEAGDKAILTATVEPDDATIKSVVWASSNPDVASVNPVTGEVTAIANGTATVSATSSSNKEVSASCVVTVGGEDPIVPTGKKLISSMKNIYWYNNGSTVEKDNEEHVNYFYDDQYRLTKIVVETYYREVSNVSSAFMRRQSPVAVKSSSPSTRTIIPVTVTAILTYGDNTVSYEISREENGVAVDSYKDGGSVVLNEDGKVVSGEWATYDHYMDEWIPYSANYELTYDNEGRLVKSVSSEEGESRITWTNGNPTKVWWGSTDNGDMVDEATYGTIPNETNLDLNWYSSLAVTEGWAFASGDSYNIFSLIDLTGTRSAYMVQSVTASQFAGEPGLVYDYTYETDADGLITKIIQKRNSSSSSGYYTSFETEITYTE